MAVATKIRSKKHAAYERLLRSKRAELLAHLQEHREEVLAERVPDDNYALATRTLMEDLAVGAIQRERALLGELEHALGRLEEGVFGICEACGVTIPERRLKALPWARFCLECAERRQPHWKN
ncbi:MAG: TraR/DksA family transcriptional regulator [Acidobacteria bacterium]|nr:TraR/DksA family transcriptional regulator [Acidobacteriota bacterium]